MFPLPETDHRSGSLAGRAARPALVLAGALAAAGAAWSALAPIPVTAHVVERGAVELEVTGTGTLEANLQAVVSTRVAGRLQRVEADEGQRVTTGQTLALLDDAELRRQVEVEQANLALARAGVQRLGADRARAQAVHSKAEADQRRNRGLLARQAISEAEADLSLEAVRVAAAELARAVAALEEGLRRVEAAEGQLAVQRERLADSVLEAPFSGLVVRRERDPGDILVPGTPVMAIVATERMQCRAWIDETALAALRVGQPARVVFRSEPQRSYEGRVVRLGKEMDRESRELLVDVEVASLPANWAVGQRADVHVRVGRREAVVCLPPALLVRPPGGGAGVFVFEEGRAAWRPVTPGAEDAAALEILEGLQPGEKVLAARDSARRPLTAGRRVALP